MSQNVTIGLSKIEQNRAGLGYKKCQEMLRDVTIELYGIRQD